MAYKALYRVYRPQDFNDVAGQEHITKTFRNALKNNKLSHAYLFSGPRGTGKTSIAKIIAKAVNCVNAPTENPCNVCSNCIEITKGMISDVIEIDAASNNGVDEIREIRDKVQFLPSVGRYKVYIIDEVHMLSTSAFNALLKTLEEPPHHVIFILATTEPHKIPATIHSRCQRFDFRGISKDEIIDRMNEVCTQENIQINKDALELIAEVSEGGMRDALSLLDQSLSYANDVITASDVHAVTGTISIDDIINVTRAMVKNDTVLALNIYEEMLKNGKETPRIVDNMISFYRDILMYQTLKEKAKDKFIYSNETFQRIAEFISRDRIYEIINILSDCQNSMKRSVDKKIMMELTLIKLTTESTTTNVSRPVATTQTTVAVAAIPDDVKIEYEAKVNKLETTLDLILDKIKMISATDGTITKTYDIEIVERILKNASLSSDNKKKKEMLQNAWIRLEDQIDVDLLGAAKLLLQTEVVAYSQNIETREIILIADETSLCNKLMEEAIQEKAKRVLSDKFRAEYRYIVLPKEAWEDIKKEYVDKLRSGDPDIKLSPIVYPGLVDRKNPFEFKQDSKIIALAKKLFDERILEIKD